MAMLTDDQLEAYSRELRDSVDLVMGLVANRSRWTDAEHAAFVRALLETHLIPTVLAVACVASDANPTTLNESMPRLLRSLTAVVPIDPADPIWSRLLDDQEERPPEWVRLLRDLGEGSQDWAQQTFDGTLASLFGP